jgi:hypothetical protein
MDRIEIPLGAVQKWYNGQWDNFPYKKGLLKRSDDECLIRKKGTPVNIRRKRFKLRK